MNIQDFFIKWNGKFNTMGSYPNQCVSIVKQYMSEILGLNEFKGDAIAYWDTPPAGFTKIKKTFYNQPQAGDIVIWNYKPYGHIGIVNWSRLFDFQCFEQNNPVGTPCHFQEHKNYQGVIGWLRPIPNIKIVPTPPKIDTKFVMDYAVFNQSPEILEAGRKLLNDWSGGKIDCTFSHMNAPCRVDGILSGDQAVQFLQSYPVKQHFVWLKYVSLNTPKYDWTKTPYIPQVDKFLTSTEGQDLTPLNVCYEFVNALVGYAQNKGIQMDAIDIFTPSEQFVKDKLITVLAILPRLL